jgi:predicted SAM-dependent methyltransferase
MPARPPLFSRPLAGSLGGMTMLQRLRQVHDRIYLSFDFPASAEQLEAIKHFDKINYACGRQQVPGWLNVDIRPVSRVPPEARSGYLKMSLTRRHPFPDASFRFGYSEDFIEHISQADSLIFLSEVYRTLAPGGVLRISTPGLKSVLRRHYRQTHFAGADTGKKEAYTPFGHVHFYSEETMATVASHLGFRKVEFKGYNQSEYEELQMRETRAEQNDLNLIAELTK